MQVVVDAEDVDAEVVVEDVDAAVRAVLVQLAAPSRIMGHGN